MAVLRLDWIDLIVADLERTRDFYTRALGLRATGPREGGRLLLDVEGSPGGLRFSARPDALAGRRGVGATHHVALSVPDLSALRRWKRRLQDLGLEVKGPYERRYFQSIYFKDPDGIILEFATRGPGWTVDEEPGQLGRAVMTPPDPHVIGRRDEAAIATDSWPDPVPQITSEMALLGLHHVTAICRDVEATARFFQQILGLNLVKRTFNFDNPRVPHWYLGPGAGLPGSVITYFGEGEIGTAPGQVGRGLTECIGFAAAGQAGLAEVRRRLEEAGVAFTEEVRGAVAVLRFSDPDGHLLEVAA